MNSNVLMIDELKGLRERRQAQDTYQRYLASLPQCQLAGEINYILDEFSEGRSQTEIISKVDLIQQELVSRADFSGKSQIAALNRKMPQ